MRHKRDDLIPLIIKKKITGEKVYEDENEKKAEYEKPLRSLVKRSFILGPTFHKLSPIGVSTFLVINFILYAFLTS